ncbi:primosomal protein N' [Oscillochloris trichoides DG-6]|uniref:Replication restart protein PriA n=1 Tax=Oscillochloris trichoides DG-6 TaxID=765420 RepID=E1IHQ6_9CHLR|nr:primosomal protein N' [Oscillochloris trichoides]EFO79276.1 primosomal protein N' [Oscillochloris trichoides DG-6]
MPNDTIAEVALRASLLLSYRVPERLHRLARVGQLVWVPLRRERVQGVIVAVRPPQPHDSRHELREVLDLADPEATIPSSGLQLASWVAQTYRAPLYDALELLLPPGVGQEAEAHYRATAAGIQATLGDLPPRERAILYYLRTHGTQSERDLRAVLRGSDSDLRDAYIALVERGLLTRDMMLSAPRVRPRTERTVRLAIPVEEVDTALTTLARAPKQAQVIHWMLEQDLARANMEEGFDGAWTTWPVDAIYTATGTTATLLRQLEERDLLKIGQREVRRDPLAGDGVPPDVPPPLTPAQQRAYTALVTALEERQAADVFLLHGVTGSGKTEIYLRVIARAMRLGRQALVLVPEIALTAQLVRRFAARFPGKIAVLHSGLGIGERYDEWRRLRRGEARLAIGSRSAVFAPLPDLGLIVVDEEHEPTYKHDAGPRYHARDVAIQLAHITKSVVILGSATPSVETYQATRTGGYHLLELDERVGGSLGPDGLHHSVALPLPPVRLVDMRQELQNGNRSIFSHALQLALTSTLERKEQSILFLNRRGAASFVMCRDCGYVAGCGSCSNPLTLHYDDQSPTSSSLICHACGRREAVPRICPHCLSPRIKDFGVGTQRVVEEVQHLFPQARVLRWDRDSVRGKHGHSQMLDTFLQGQADVLVGTQMIAKGLDLPLVALVGVIAADTGLHMPDFRSGERTFQLLTQVAGRAGRRSAGAQVIFQTYSPDHYALLAAQEHDYRVFFRQEIAYRRELGYPPFGRLVRLIYTASKPSICKREATAVASKIEELIEERDLSGWSLIGPAPAFFQRSRGQWRWHLILRIPMPQAESSSIAGFLDLLGPLHGWTVDVDPVQVL